MKPTHSSRKKASIFLLIIILIGMAMQFIRPPLDNPPLTADLDAPPQVKVILRRACYDCHSNETRLAWFDQPAPAYWFVVKDVRDGRKVLNFSLFDSLPKGVQAAKLFESIFQVEQQGMPLSQYTFLHHGGIVSADEIGVLKQYVLTLGYHPRVDTVRQRVAREQYAAWVGGGGGGAGTGAGGLTAGGATASGTTAAVTVAGVKDEYNGVAYGPLSGFGDWTPVSTTERYDNGTLRVILGNDVVVKAIREGHNHPWPEGAVFAKVAWDQLPDSSGEIRAGAFRQVEFMIRDSKKYAASFGWGWGRWVGGLALKPYGKDASFVAECMNCHRPLDKTDHTFTFPLADTLNLYDQAASLPDSVGAYPLKGKVITSIVNMRDGTMSTLYGNDVAVRSARGGRAYSAGAMVSLVTWSQREDPHWFGGRIPKGLQVVETVRYDAGGAPAYGRFEGMPLVKKMPAPDVIAARVQYITAKKASVVP
jgi:hypothetical protein